MSGLYVHIPFCAALCPYCDFAVVVGRRDAHAPYCSALLEEARVARWDREVTSVFFGGGTPTAIGSSLLLRTLDSLDAIVPVAPGAEITVEANPESAGAELLGDLRTGGFSRVSIGAQSFAPGVLRTLGRGHDPDLIRWAFANARDAGFDNVSLDLIYGTEGESDDDWADTVAEAIALGPEHVSCYALTIEPDTAFGKAVRRGYMDEPDPDALARRYETAEELLGLAGYRHYEISNWAKPGRESKHNLATWLQGDYLGLGVGAHSHRDGVRWSNTRNIVRYMSSPAEARETVEHLDGTQRAEEWVALRLRLVEGLDVAEAARRLGRPLDAAIARITEAGLGRVRDGRLVLTPQGLLLENEIAASLLEPVRA